ncbi:MAG: hypothetical protein Q8M92_01040 [Candidatus Subteraquimicrobiales bacterium]|nr:hypothetical protein [Candidatus Subteraquimicrobiales bacterium]
MKPYICFTKVTKLFFRNKFETAVYLSSDKQKYVIRISNFPIYPEPEKGNVYLIIPRDTFTLSSDKLSFRPLQQSHMRIYQTQEGNPFIHPHIFEGGTPCLNSRGIDSARSLFVWTIQTLIYGNISKDTIEKGGHANHSLGNTPNQILRNVSTHRTYLRTSLGSIIDRNVGYMGRFFGGTFGDCISET